MLPDIYAWIEQYSGVSCDFNDDIKDVSGNVIYIDPVVWRVSISDILDNLTEAIRTIDEFGNLAPDDLPSKSDMRKIISEYVIEKLLSIVNKIKKQMSIEQVDIGRYEDLIKHVDLLSRLVEFIVQNPMEEIAKHNLFEKFDEEHGNEYTEILNITKGDIANMHIVVTSIREDYFESLDDEDDDE